MPNYKEYSLKFREIYQLISILLMTSMLAWIIGLPALGFMNNAKAAALTSASMLMSDTDSGSQASATLRFTVASAILASHTIKVTFSSNYTTSANFSATNIKIATGASPSAAALGAVGTCGGGNVFELTTVTSRIFTFTHCNGGSSVATSTPMHIYFGVTAAGPKFVNPTTGASGQAHTNSVEITTQQSDGAEVMTATYDDVVATAAVSSTFSFGIDPVATSSSTCNEASGSPSVTTTSTTIPWGVLSPGSAKTACQVLNVATNAANGHRVTLYADDPNASLVSGTGADIDNFYVTTTGTPIAWTSPTGNINAEGTWGHWGVTSEDESLGTTLQGDPLACGNANLYGVALYHGIGTTSSPLLVFCHNGPAAANGPGTGTTRVGFKIEVGALQETASDYTSNLTYVATPVF